MSLNNPNQFKLGPTKQGQADFVLSARGRKVMDGIQVPGTVVTTDSSAAPVNVGQGNILRIRVTATTYIAFGNDPTAAPVVGAVSSSTSPALELFTAGVYLVVATGDFLRSSAALTRLEVIQG